MRIDNKFLLILMIFFFQTLDILQQFCSNCGYGYLRLDGQTSTNIRQEIVTKFNSKHCLESNYININ